MVKDSDTSGDGADVIADFMRMGRLEDLCSLEVGAGPSDHGICKLVLAAVNKRMIYTDGKPRMLLFTVSTPASIKAFAHERSTDARDRLLWKMAKDAPRGGERQIELHKFIDYPLDLVPKMYGAW